jgi:dihydroorotase-like cyclic amidohydrolase
VIDTLGSDHCPFRKEDKEGLIWDEKTSFPGSATMLPVLLNEGWNLKGWPVMTLVRGQVVMKDAQITGSPGHGRLIESRFA